MQSRLGCRGSNKSLTLYTSCFDMMSSKHE